MDDSSRVSLLALIVALLALVIALGQLVQQIFGTADGYRRCQKSVIGPWAKYTKLQWRWSQFRFETKFATPDIRLKDARLGEGYHDLFAWQSHGDDRSLPRSESEPEAAVSWGRFLSEVRAKEQWKAKGEASLLSTIGSALNTVSAMTPMLRIPQQFEVLSAGSGTA
jgi:hypothetical protein